MNEPMYDTLTLILVTYREDGTPVDSLVLKEDLDNPVIYSFTRFSINEDYIINITLNKESYYLEHDTWEIIHVEKEEYSYVINENGYFEKIDIQY